ncbi:hypothetical protein CLOSTMETH_01505 [[Clostridium] methylpentosum DSM 5476]|uniref:Uncharacterized protein n=1 Tax=[Clostridium] methylpentosum DSM 5476 TaxID=537013 RepID=C0ECD5_9FIRM|nr:hypothetical protein CLOSTMETH_01505 [[Clostridium] methylpentosum DSM 5476]
MSVEYHQTTLSLEISHELRYTIFGWYAYQHVDMIRTCFCFDDLYSFVLTSFSQYFSNIRFYFPIDDLSPIFRCKYDMVLAIPFRIPKGQTLRLTTSIVHLE